MSECPSLRRSLRLKSSCFFLCWRLRSPETVLRGLSVGCRWLLVSRFPRWPRFRMLGDALGWRFPLVLRSTLCRVAGDPGRVTLVRHETRSTAARQLARLCCARGSRDRGRVPPVRAENSARNRRPSSLYCDLIVTKKLKPKNRLELSPIESWRPRRDSNPRYRRERAMS